MTIRNVMVRHENERGKVKDMIKKAFILAIWICAPTHTAVAKDFFLVKYAKSMKDKVFVVKASNVPYPAGRSLRSEGSILDYYLTKGQLSEQPNRERRYPVSGNRYELRDARYAKTRDMLEVKFNSGRQAEIKLHFPNASGLSKSDFANLMATIFLTDPEDTAGMMDNFKELIKDYFERRRKTCY